MKLNITHAAKTAGIARRTLQRHIEKGKVSYEIGKHGNKLIDTSELVRVYGELNAPATPDAVGQVGQKSPHDASEVALLRQRVSDLQILVDELRGDKGKYTRENEKLLTIVEQQTRMLTYMSTKRPLFHRIRLALGLGE